MLQYVTKKLLWEIGGEVTEWFTVSPRYGKLTCFPLSRTSFPLCVCWYGRAEMQKIICRWYNSPFNPLQDTGWWQNGKQFDIVQLHIPRTLCWHSRKHLLMVQCFFFVVYAMLTCVKCLHFSIQVSVWFRFNRTTNVKLLCTSLIVTNTILVFSLCFPPISGFVLPDVGLWTSLLRCQHSTCNCSYHWQLTLGTPLWRQQLAFAFSL